MKCPICGQELRPGKKDPNYLLCYNCKKKFKIPQSAHKVQKRAEKPEPEEQKYSNIPPKEVREKREQEMRDAYDELLAVGDGKKKKKPAPKPQRIVEFCNLMLHMVCILRHGKLWRRKLKTHTNRHERRTHQHTERSRPHMLCPDRKLRHRDCSRDRRKQQEKHFPVRRLHPEGADVIVSKRIPHKYQHTRGVGRIHAAPAAKPLPLCHQKEKRCESQYQTDAPGPELPEFTF